MYSELIKQLQTMSKASAALSVFFPQSEGSIMAKLLIDAANAIEELSGKRETGKWMEIRQGVIPSGYCSQCEIWNRVTPYCPNCGATMKGE